MRLRIIVHARTNIPITLIKQDDIARHAKTTSTTNIFLLLPLLFYNQNKIKIITKFSITIQIRNQNFRICIVILNFVIKLKGFQCCKKNPNNLNRNIEGEPTIFPITYIRSHSQIQNRTNTIDWTLFKVLYSTRSNPIAFKYTHLKYPTNIFPFSSKKKISRVNKKSKILLLYWHIWGSKYWETSLVESYWWSLQFKKVYWH